MCKLSIHEQRRAVNARCCICEQPVMPNTESVEFIKLRDGRYIKYAWFHTMCLLKKSNQLERGKEISG